MKTYVALLERIPASLRDLHIAHIQGFALPGAVPPWTDTGIPVAAGQAFTLLAAGRIHWPGPPGLWGGPRYHLWGRIGPAGVIFNPAQDTATWTAETAGSLHLAIYHGFWATRTGELATTTRAYRRLRGELHVLVIVWKGDPAAGLAALHGAAGNDPLIAAERLRLATPSARPPGWVPLWQLGETDLFTPAGTLDHPTIRMEARNDQGILTKPVALDLTADTRLRWRWRVLALPTAEAENAVGTHDYTAIGVEFDDGRDLTYYWSAALAVGSAFRCPVRHWGERETHLVVRTGRERLGTWTDEERSVLADCAAVMGSPPARIVAVWLIAVSTFGHGTAIAEVADIALVDGPRRLSILG